MTCNFTNKPKVKVRFIGKVIRHSIKVISTEKKVMKNVSDEK